MKKNYLLFVLWVFLPILLNAQALKVKSDGSVIAFTPGFTEGGYDVGSKFSIKSNWERGLYVERTGSTSNVWAQSIIGMNYPVAGTTNVGVQGQAYSYTVLDSGRSIGLLGVAGNTTSGYNVGAAGYILGTQNGAGVWGGLDGTPQYIPGRYAGYFDGDVRVTGLLSAVTITVPSDVQYKKNIVELGDQESSVLKNVLNFNPVEYNLQQTYLKSASDTMKLGIKLFDESSQEFNRKHFGLLAQEVQQLYPNLVYEDSNGYLSVDYIGIVPLLITSLKEMHAEMEQLKASIAELSIVTGVSNAPDASQSAKLYQNAPNPFSERTKIKFYLPASVSTAYLGIYNLQGKQVKQFKIMERGEGFQDISGSEFVPGIYLYGLVADGKEVDVKRMILTE